MTLFLSEVGWSGYPVNQASVGTVVLHDGHTPAWGARVALFAGRGDQPTTIQCVDPLRRPRDTVDWTAPCRLRLDLGRMNLDRERMQHPVLVAWLPGTAGAVIVPWRVGAASRIVLPASISCSGRITVAGGPVSSLRSSFHVLALYQGTDIENECRTVDATAEADGSFTLAGLTSGVYHVQAARDNIWLSTTRTLVVGTSGAPRDLHLDIATPGQPFDITVVDAAVKPCPRAAISVVLPAGPLTDAIWPSHLTTSGAGRLHIEGLPAGTLRLTTIRTPETLGKTTTST